MKVIEFNNIKLKIGNNIILKNISFCVEKGDIYGLVGHNGAGKTSLIRILLGLVQNYSGELRLFSDINLEKQRRLIGSVLDSLLMDGRLTAGRYIHNICCMSQNASKEYENNILKTVGLLNTGNKKINNFSLGMKRRLMIAGALACRPQLLVMDEPFNGIDADGMADLRLMLQQFASEGITVLITSHNIPELLKLSNKFGVMHNGTFVCEMSDTELTSIKKYKTVFSTDKPQQLVFEIKKIYPDIECYANSPGQISVLREINNIQQRQLKNSINNCSISDSFISLMSEEEILLWKMNGHTI